MKFIDFILDAQRDPKLIADFVLIEEKDELLSFFKKYGYDEIDDTECEKILKAKKIQYRMSSVGTRAY